MKGFTDGSIVFDATIGVWIIVDESMSGWDRKLKGDFKVIGKQLESNSKPTMPTGLQRWQLFDDNCQGTRDLMFSPVNLHS